MTPRERAEFEGRLSDLGGRLGKVKAQRDADEQADRDARMRGRGMAYGMRMAVDLVAGVFVGGLIGWGLDWALSSRPWLTLVFLLLGFVAGVLNVMRGYERLQREFAARTGGSTGQRVPDDD
jgi:ATP synthase protein I